MFEIARSEAQKRADAKYAKAHHKTAACTLNSEEYKAFKKYAEDRGKTISGMLLEYVRDCIGDSSTEKKDHRQVYTIGDQSFIGRKALQEYLNSIGVDVSDNIINNYLSKGRLSAEVKERFPILEEIRKGSEN